MHHFRRLVGLVLLALLLLCSVSYASEDAGEEARAKAAIETFLRSYAEEALLYTDTDQRVCTISDPALALSGEDASQLLTLSGGEADLAQMRDNIALIEKKAAFYAAARQMQNIFREDLRLTYTYRELELGENTGHASVTENAGFRYTDSDRCSVYETIYNVDMVKLAGQWLVASATDGSQFDADHPTAADFDVQAALEELHAALEAEVCTVIYPLSWAEKAGKAGSGQIPYHGEHAAAYAYTYARQYAGQPREAFYSPQFESYAGRGGDCMNFASQCMWAGFGGSQTAAAIDSHDVPMDTAGETVWFGRGPAAGSKVKNTLSWISCSSFRKYLTGTADGLGMTGSNASAEPGMYATILHVSAGSPLSGVTAAELVGAVAHVEGVGGAHAHAIVLTAATGTRRSEIWFCSHTKDMTHIKLGDYYLGPIKVYIPRYLRTSGPSGSAIHPDRIPPVLVSDSAALGFRCGEAQYSMTVTVTAPGKTEGVSSSVSQTDSCAMELQFETPGLYRVDCSAQPTETAAVNKRTFYVRCLESPAEEQGADAVPGPEVPAWLFSKEEEIAPPASGN